MNWTNAFVYTRDARSSGYHVGVVSGQNGMYNAAGDPVTIKSTNGNPFTLYSAAVTAAWYDNLELTVVGYNSNITVANNTFILQVFSVSHLTFNGYSEVDTIIFSTSKGKKNPLVETKGRQFAMDNICLSFT